MADKMSIAEAYKKYFYKNGAHLKGADFVMAYKEFIIDAYNTAGYGDILLAVLRYGLCNSLLERAEHRRVVCQNSRIAVNKRYAYIVYHLVENRAAGCHDL